ncbi:MAG: PHP-associated domain-containing protein, partial [Nanoarchaeota archaeon]|nr:PHP-associated domain-containing protein [Nanoarchaeota archaeon]
KSKGILMIPGIEKRIEGKETLIYAKTKKVIQETLDIKTFEDLRTFRKKHGKDILIIAPHPFFIKSQCLGNKLEEYSDLFDGVEYSHYYTRLINKNKPGVKVARKNNLTIFGNSDIHRLYQIGLTYSRVKAEKNMDSIFEAIRHGKVKVITKPLSFFKFIKITFGLVSSVAIKKPKKLN